VDHRDPRLELVHLLRGITVELDLLGAEFATGNGLHPTDLRALIHLLNFDRAGTDATPGRLGDHLGLNSPAVTAVVDRLQRLGLVRRERDERDRRRVLLAVTEQATDLGWSFFGRLIGDMVTAAEGFDEGELATVRRFLQTVRSVLAAWRQQA
jgi:DNA-binding MarR family transcriptional regulator